MSPKRRARVFGAQPASRRPGVQNPLYKAPGSSEPAGATDQVLHLAHMVCMWARRCCSRQAGFVTAGRHSAGRSPHSMRTARRKACTRCAAGSGQPFGTLGRAECASCSKGRRTARHSRRTHHAQRRWRRRPRRRCGGVARARASQQQCQLRSGGGARSRS